MTAISLTASADEAGRLAEGCCSAISPCPHQQRSPGTICDVCTRAGRLVPATQTQREVRPAAKWRTQGEADPHRAHYDCERANLALGGMTDDELANAVFLHGDERPDFNDVLAGKAKMSIVYLTAAKDRIRWLSRRLVAAEAALAATPTPPAPSRDAVEAMQLLDEAYSVMAVAFNRIHSLPRVTDDEIAKKLGTVRGKIERFRKAALASADTRQGDGAAIREALELFLAIRMQAFTDSRDVDADLVALAGVLAGDADNRCLSYLRARAALTTSADQDGK